MEGKVADKVKKKKSQKLKDAMKVFRGKNARGKAVRRLNDSRIHPTRVKILMAHKDERMTVSIWDIRSLYGEKKPLAKGLSWKCEGFKGGKARAQAREFVLKNKLEPAYFHVTMTYREKRMCVTVWYVSKK